MCCGISIPAEWTAAVAADPSDGDDSDDDDELCALRLTNNSLY